MDTAVALGVVAGLTHVGGYLLYARKMLAGGCRPNLASWLLWVFLTVMNCLSYLAMSEDAVKAAIPIVSSFACTAVFIIALRTGRFSRPDMTDIVAFGVGLAAAAVWWWLRSASVANMLMQICLAASFIPTYRGIWRDPRAERSEPWFVWCIAYSIAISVVVLRWNGQYLELAYPMLALLMSSGVGLLALRKPRVLIA